MRKIKLALLLILSVTLGSLTLFGNRRQQLPPIMAFPLYERIIRHDADSAPLPIYPEDAAGRGISGLVDSAVVFQPGNPIHIKILESPDCSLSKQ
jgi:hypothetical protein